MNKLLGFYELKKSPIPTIPWKEFKEDSYLDEDKLWTVRSAVFSGDDLNLPRMVGGNAMEAYKFALDLQRRLGDNGLVIYYPYFVAEKSGTLQVGDNSVVIEAVDGDLWNMVTYSDRDVTLRYIDEQEVLYGKRDFLGEEEVKELLEQIRFVKRLFRDELLMGKDALLEWSYAYDSNRNHERVGEKYLIFYEARTI